MCKITTNDNSETMRMPFRNYVKVKKRLQKIHEELESVVLKFCMKEVLVI